MNNKIFFKTNALVFLFILAVGCTRKTEETSTVRIQLPPSTTTVSQKVTTQSVTWGYSDPTLITDVKCYAIMVGGDEPALQNRICKNASEAEVARVGIFMGAFPAGGKAELDVPSGANRKIYLVGFAANATSDCNDFNSGSGPNYSALSAPHIVSQKTVDLAAGTVEISMLASLSGSVKFNNCDFPVPPAPSAGVLITSPAASSYVNNSNVSTFSLSGTCSFNSQLVTLSGAASGTAICSSNVWTKTVDLTALGQGSFSICVDHDDGAGNMAPQNCRAFVKDSVSPAASGVPTYNNWFYSTTSSPQLSFSASGAPDLSHYLIDVGTSSSGNDVLNDFSTNSNSNVVVTGLSLTHNTNYFISVSAVDLAGNISSVSNGVAWTVDNTPPTDPTGLGLGSSYSTVDSETPTITHVAGSDSESGIQGTYIDVGTNPGGTDVALGMSAPVTGTALTGLPSLTNGQTYYVTIYNKNNAGDISTKIPIGSFVFDDTPPAAPTITLSASVLTTDNITPNINFAEPTDTSGIQGYYVDVGTDAGANAESIVNDVYISTPSVSVALPSLTSGTTYYIRVKAKDNAGNYSSYSNSETFQYIVPAVLSISNAPTYDFGTVAQGSSTDFTFTITNSGLAAATSISESGLAAPYSMKGGAFPGTGGTCGASLAGGASCTVVVNFAPTTTGTISDTIILSYNDGIDAQIVTRDLTGTVVTPALLSLNAGAFNFFGVPQGQSLSRKIKVQNSGGFQATGISNQTFTGTVFNFNGGSYPGTNGDCTATLNPASFCYIDIQFTPAANSFYNNSFALDYYDGAITQNVSMSLFGFGYTNQGGSSLLTGTPAARKLASSFFTGATGFFFGGTNGSPINTLTTFTASDESWNTRTTGGTAPSPRLDSASVNAGSRLIVWGGWDGSSSYFNDGGFIDLKTDSWVTMGLPNAPPPRKEHSGVYTGNAAIFWGGQDNSGLYLNSGKKYFPNTNAWDTAEISVVGAPSARKGHASAWTGSRMLIWGGEGSGGIPMGNGGLYDPATNTWSEISPYGSGPSYIVKTSVKQTDGKIIIGGIFNTYNGFAQNYIARLLPDGSLDHTFNIGTGFNGAVYSLAIQPDGKILVGGTFSSFNGSSSNRVIRLNTNGSIDTTFNIGTGIDNSPGTKVNSIVVQGDSKIVLAGVFSTYNSNSAVNIVRVNADGSIDLSFNSGTGFTNEVNSLALQSDQKIIAAGSFTFYNSVGSNYIIRLNSDGSIDNTFAIGTGFNSYVRSLAIQSDGKILIGGNFTSYQGSPSNRIIRLETNGSKDATFNIGTGFTNIVNSVAVLTTGKIVVGGGFTNFNGTVQNYITRLNPDGTRDASVNNGAGLSSTVEHLYSLGDDKFIAGGNFLTFEGFNAKYILQMNASFTLNTSFNFQQPQARKNFAYSWSGKKLFVYGGVNLSNVKLNDGGIYDPSTNSWVKFGGGHTLSPRDFAKTVWTGTHLIVFGGRDHSNMALNDGGIYDPANNSWQFFNIPGLIDGIYNHSLMWTGTKLLIAFGGSNAGLTPNSFLYDPGFVGTTGRRIKQLTSGQFFNCGIFDSNEMKCWGHNTAGQLGYNDTNNRGDNELLNSYSSVSLTAPPVQVSAGTWHSCSLLADNSVRCWGDNTSNQCGVVSGSTIFNTGLLSPVSGFSTSEIPIKVSSGLYHSCALLEDSRVKCWGSNSTGQLGTGDNTNSSSSVFVRNETNSGDLYGIVDIDVGGTNTCAITEDGRVLCWGSGSLGQLGNGNLTNSSLPVYVSGILEGANKISTGNNYSCALVYDSLKCWGNNANSQLGDGSTTNRSLFVTPIASGVSDFSVNASHTCANQNNQLKCWGFNLYGQLGLNSTTQTWLPSPVNTVGYNIDKISIGENYSCGINSSGHTYCWGLNSNGQLGLGNTINYGDNINIMSILPPVMF